MAKLPETKISVQTKKPKIKKVSLSVGKDSTSPRSKIENKSIAKSKKTEVKVKKANSIKLTSAQKGRKINVFISDNTHKTTTPQKVKEKQSPVKENTQKTRILKIISGREVFTFLPSERLVSKVSRIAGVFFVSVGALFSLLNLSDANGIAYIQNSTFSNSNMSQTIDSLTTSNLNFNTNITIDHNHKTPLDNGHFKLMDIVPINITTSPYAKKVTLILFDRETNRKISIGNAEYKDQTNWNYQFDTNKTPNGIYELHALVFAGGTDSYVKSTPIYEIQNPVQETVGSNTNLNDTAIPPDAIDTTVVIPPTVPPVPPVEEVKSTASTTTPIIVKQDVVYEVTVRRRDSQDTLPYINFDINAKKADSVRLYALNKKTSVQYLMGKAERANNNSDYWTFNWNSVLVPDGIYEVTANAFIEKVPVKSSGIKVIVENVSESPKATVSSSTTKISDSISSSTTVYTAIHPIMSISVAESFAETGYVMVKTDVENAESVEVYIVPLNALTSLFLGRSQKISDRGWEFKWDTKQTPNNEYFLFVRAKTNYGFTDSESVYFSVLNTSKTILTTEQEEIIDTVNETQKVLVRTTPLYEVGEKEPVKDSYPAPEVVYVQPVETFVETIKTTSSSHSKIKSLLKEFESNLKAKLDEYASAVREGDMAKAEKISKEIDDLKQKAILEIPESEDRKDIESSVDTYLTKLAFELQELVRRNESILKERLGDLVAQDSDSDDISDYDEINLYHTNPFSADTDGDGFIDSVEIKLGYNPHDSKKEALMQYESPQETGIVRTDILSIDSIATLPEEVENEFEKEPVKALIAGKGLPNSFVTLYIYSTPIVMTVKTTSDGSWSYIFDKELENGDHKIYVGMTDNTGKIIAKSNPLSFAKTAEAFTNTDAAAIATPVSEPSLVSNSNMLLVASIAIVALGLVLILLGLHANKKEDFELVTA